MIGINCIDRYGGAFYHSSSTLEKIKTRFASADDRPLGKEEVYTLMRSLQSSGSTFQRLFLGKTLKGMRASFLKSMDFEQLRAAREALGAAEFHRSIQTINSLPHTMWNSIQDICNLSDIAKIKKLIASETLVRLSRNYPYLLVTLDNELSAKLKPHDYETLRPLIEKIAPPEAGLQRISFEIAGFPSLLIQHGAVQRYFEGPLRIDMFGRLEEPDLKASSIRVNSEVVKTMQDYEQFKRYVHRINGRPLAANLDQLLEELNFANKWGQEQVIALIEADIVTKLNDAPDAALYAHVKTRLQKDIARATEPFKQLQKKASQKFLPPALTESNFQHYFNIVCDLQIQGKCETMLTFVLERQQQGPVWVDRLWRLVEEGEFAQFSPETRQAVVNQRTVSRLYELALQKLKDHPGNSSMILLKESCINWAISQGIDAAALAWKMNIPTEILEKIPS